MYLPLYADGPAFQGTKLFWQRRTRKYVALTHFSRDHQQHRARTRQEILRHRPWPACYFGHASFRVCVNRRSSGAASLPTSRNHSPPSLTKSGKKRGCGLGQRGWSFSRQVETASRNATFGVVSVLIRQPHSFSSSTLLRRGFFPWQRKPEA